MDRTPYMRQPIRTARISMKRSSATALSLRGSLRRHASRGVRIVRESSVVIELRTENEYLELPLTRSCTIESLTLPARFRDGFNRTAT
jgi:hypothetical protein